MPDSHVSEQSESIQIKLYSYNFSKKINKRNLENVDIFWNINFLSGKNTGNRDIFLKLKKRFFEKIKNFEK